MTPKQVQFVKEYLIDLNATQAAIRAGYSARTARQIGEENLSKPDIAILVKEALDQRSLRTEITADRVLEELWAIATADPNDLIQFRRGACPSCWGEPEADERLEDQPHGGALKRAQKPNEVPAALEINRNCEVCGGEGMGRAFIADTRTLTGAARSLYAGVKITKDGVEVKMHDKAAALVNVGRHLGMFKDKVEYSFDLTEEDQAWLNKRS